jgi:hypothetical protein
MLFILLAAPVAADAGATTSVRIIKFSDDGTAVENARTVTYQWLEQNLKIYGDGVTHYYHQGPIFEGDVWDPEEINNLKDKGAVKGTAIKDLCDLVGGMSPEDEVSVRAVDGWHTEFGYANVYEPLDIQGTISLCWFKGDEGQPGEDYGFGYPAKDKFNSAMQIVIMAGTTNRDGQYVFGNNDMRIAMPEEKYQHFYEGLPSTNGLSGKWITEIWIYPAGVTPTADTGQQTAAAPPSSGTPEQFPWLPVGLGAGGILVICLAFLLNRTEGAIIIFRAVLAAGILLIAAAPLTYFHPWQPDSGDAYKNWDLTLVGAGGEQQVLSYKDITAMPTYEGSGGFFTTVGVINGPFKVKGVPVEDLCRLVGGISPDDIVLVSASDGYSTVLDYDHIMGDFITYAPVTLKETPHGEIKPILMYEQDGRPLSEDDGRPVRMAVAGTDGLMTEGLYWTKWVNKIEIIPVK